jgi:hypothetical protein
MVSCEFGSSKEMWLGHKAYCLKCGDPVAIIIRRPYNSNHMRQIKKTLVS